MPPPPCRRMGRQCQTLDVTLRVTAVEGEEDHDATWLLGHTERIDFGPLFENDGELWSEADIHVPCRFLTRGLDGRSAHCSAHGYEGRVPAPTRVPAARRLGRDRFAVVDRKRLATRHLPPPPPAPVSARSLPVTQSANPCATAPCRTSDLKRGSACCRDVQVDIVCSRSQTMLESLIRNRKAPYLCKAERENDEQLVVEIISACSFLKEDGACDLHGRSRADGRPAKPIMCSRWPKARKSLHAGCAWKNRRLPLG